MKYISNVGKKFAHKFKAQGSTLSNPASWLMQLLGSNASSAGTAITIQTVLGIPEVFNAVCRISGHVASMPLRAVRESDSGDKEFVSQPGVRLWNSPGQFTRAEIVEKLMVDVLLLGNGRLFISRDANGIPNGLIPIQSAYARTVVIDGKRWHCVTVDSGNDSGIDSAFNSPKTTNDIKAGNYYKIPDEDVFYVMGLTTNGYWGENILSLARDIFGLSIAGAESAGALYQNSGKPGLLIEAPTGLFRDKKEAKEWLDSFNEMHSGVDNAGRTGMLANGMKAVQMQFQTMDSSHVSMRQFQREAAALIFLLESIVGSDTSAYKGVTEKNTAYSVNCLLRIRNKIQLEADRKLLTGRARNSELVYTELSMMPLHQADRNGLALYTSSLRQQNVISTDEVRMMHGLTKAVSDDENDYSVDYRWQYPAESGESGETSADPTEELQSDPNESEPSELEENEDD